MADEQRRRRENRLAEVLGIAARVVVAVGTVLYLLLFEWSTDQFSVEVRCTVRASTPDSAVEPSLDR